MTLTGLPISVLILPPTQSPASATPKLATRQGSADLSADQFILPRPHKAKATPIATPSLAIHGAFSSAISRTVAVPPPINTLSEPAQMVPPHRLWSPTRAAG